MEDLFIEATQATPQIDFIGSKGHFSIVGKSYPENVSIFYSPVFDYIKLYKSNPHTKTTLEFKWLYYNTSTSKIIVKIILLLKEVDNEFEINWCCKPDFDLIIEKGLEFQKVLDVNLNIVHI